MGKHKLHKVNQDQRKAQAHGCVGKRPYATYYAAQRKAAYLSARQEEVLCAYRCHFCGTFHVGHVNFQQRSRMQRLRRIDQLAVLTQQMRGGEVIASNG